MKKEIFLLEAHNTVQLRGMIEDKLEAERTEGNDAKVLTITGANAHYNLYTAWLEITPKKKKNN